MIAIPFEGDPEFFDVRPQTFGTELPQAEVENGEIRLAYVRTDHDPEALKRDYERALSIINQNLSSLRESARTSNSRLEELALEYETAEEVIASMKSGIFDSVEAKLKERDPPIVDATFLPSLPVPVWSESQGLKQGRRYRVSLWIS